jgi:hypothetical protein
LDEHALAAKPVAAPEFVQMPQKVAPRGADGDILSPAPEPRLHDRWKVEVGRERASTYVCRPRLRQAEAIEYARSLQLVVTGEERRCTVERADSAALDSAQLPQTGFDAVECVTHIQTAEHDVSRAGSPRKPGRLHDVCV